MSTYPVIRTPRFQEAYRHYRDEVKLSRLEEIVSGLEVILSARPDYGTKGESYKQYTLYSRKPFDVSTKIHYRIVWLFDGEKVLLWDIFQEE